ncbi:MAG: hypothetical protein CK548_03515 [Opitutia bacterium]|nr:MAG: hypothetical protein CK548_03515 [Opitutae bacterium]
MPLVAQRIGYGFGEHVVGGPGLLQKDLAVAKLERDGVTRLEPQSLAPAPQGGRLAFAAEFTDGEGLHGG